MIRQGTIRSIDREIGIGIITDENSQEIEFLLTDEDAEMEADILVYFEIMQTPRGLMAGRLRRIES